MQLVMAQKPTTTCPKSPQFCLIPCAPQNLLCMKLAAEMGVLVASPWVTWVKVRSEGWLAFRAACWCIELA